MAAVTLTQGPRDQAVRVSTFLTREEAHGPDHVKVELWNLAEDVTIDLSIIQAWALRNWLNDVLAQFESLAESFREVEQ